MCNGPDCAVAGNPRSAGQERGPGGRHGHVDGGARPPGSNPQGPHAPLPGRRGHGPLGPAAGLLPPPGAAPGLGPAAGPSPSRHRLPLLPLPPGAHRPGRGAAAGPAPDPTPSSPAHPSPCPPGPRVVGVVVGVVLALRPRRLAHQRRRADPRGRVLDGVPQPCCRLSSPSSSPSPSPPTGPTQSRLRGGLVALPRRERPRPPAHARRGRSGGTLVRRERQP